VQAGHTKGMVRRWGVAAALGPMVLMPLGGPAALAQEAFPPRVPEFPNNPGPVRVVNPAAMELKVRRVRDAVEVVIENTGTGPQLEQSNQGGSWMGRLYTSRPSALLRGPQAVAVPDAGFASISIEGGGTIYNLKVTPVGGYPVRTPLVSADGRNVVLSFPAAVLSMQRNSLAPGAVANPNWAPPLRQRATAPPVGDMAVGTMLLKDPSHLNVRGPRVSLTFKNVSAHNALQALAQKGEPEGPFSKRRYGFVYNNRNTNSTVTASDTFQSGTGVSSSQTTVSKPTNEIISPRVTASFVDEDYATAFNMILASTGLQAKLVGNTIIAGPDALSSNAGGLASKVYRLNQASAKSAAQYLASLGALIRIPRTFTTTESAGTATNVGGGSTGGGQTASNTSSSTSTGTAIEAYGGQPGPLQGLSGTIDGRLGTITLVGLPRLVTIAEQYLKQIDLRQRQVALSIRVLDVTLDNDTSTENSFAFRYGNNFIVNDRGQLVGAFGNLLPPSTDPTSSGAFDRDIPREFNFEIDDTGRITSDITPGFNAVGGAARNSTQAAPIGTIFKGATPRNIGQLYPKNQFFDFVQSQIASGSTKVLASPTLILSENSGEISNQDTQSSSSIDEDNFLGSISTNNLVPAIGRSKANESAVVVGERIITGFEVVTGENGAPNSCQPQFGIAGLTFGARVSKIDDNGFVTFLLSPTISAASGQTFIPGCGNVSLLTLRSLDTGSARVRDGQTLILTGVLSDRDLQLASKWPVLGDLPIVGQFFRSSQNRREKRELVIMVTPRIINDTEGGTYGYGYEPSTRDTRQFMNASPASAMPNYYPQP
jgi:type IV pilus assembly protein PilQ